MGCFQLLCFVWIFFFFCCYEVVLPGTFSHMSFSEQMDIFLFGICLGIELLDWECLCMFSSNRYCQTVFQHGCTNLHSGSGKSASLSISLPVTSFHGPVFPVEGLVAIITPFLSPQHSFFLSCQPFHLCASLLEKAPLSTNCLENLKCYCLFNMSD